MCEHGPWIDSLGSEIKRIREEIEASELDLMRHEEKLAAEGGLTLADAPVVTTDTSLAHLAGALGVPTTVLLGKVPDWRWLREGDSTDWYPSMQLVRQTEMGDWDDVVRRAHRNTGRNTWKECPPMIRKSPQKPPTGLPAVFI